MGQPEDFFSITHNTYKLNVWPSETSKGQVDIKSFIQGRSFLAANNFNMFFFTENYGLIQLYSNLWRSHCTLSLSKIH